MRKALTVAMREYRVNVRSRGFLVGLFLMPVFMGGGVIVQAMVEKQGDHSVRKVAVVDRTGKLFDALSEAADARNKKDIFDPDTKLQMEPTFVLTNIPPKDGDRKAQLLELSDKVRDNEYFAVVEIGANVFQAGPDPKATEVRYFSNHTTYRDLPRWLEDTIGERVKAVRFAEAGLKRNVVMKALAPVELGRFGLLTKTDTGEIKEAPEEDPMGSFMVPFFALMLMFMLLMIGVQPLLSGVLEEKMQRITEVLLGSLRPFDLMLGKLIGTTMVSLTLLAIYAAGGFAVAKHFGKTDMIDPTIAVWFVAFLVTAIFMYGSLTLSAGASCNDLKEAQSYMMPIMFPMILPMFFIGPIIRDPSGAMATTLSLIPFTSPILMTMRKTMQVPVPAWQPPVAIIGCILLMLACVWLAGRIFRIGLLMQGKPPKLVDLARWAIRG